MTDTEERIVMKISFNDFWILYDYKADKKKCIPKWNRLKAEAQKKIMDYLPGYIKSTPDKMYRKHPATFLNNESWENEIVKDKGEVTIGRVVRAKETQDFKKVIKERDARIEKEGKWDGKNVE